MDFLKKKIDNAIIDVYTPSSIPSSRFFDTKTGLLMNNQILPFRGKSDTNPGLYDTGIKLPNGKPVLFINKPEEGDTRYDTTTDCIDFSNKENISSYMAHIDELNKMSNSIIANVDAEFQPVPKKTDAKSIQALKMAVCDKHCDINKYKSRFGPNFNNDKRLFEKDHMGLQKMIEIGNNLDLSLSLIIEDKDPSLPNSIHKKIKANLTDESPIEIIYDNGDIEEVTI